MASTVKAKTLRVTVQEDIVLNGVNYGSKRKVNIASVNEILKRVVTLPASNTTTLLTFNDNVYGAAGAIDTGDAKYIRITNLDDANSIELAFIDASGLYQIRLSAGESYMLGSPEVLQLTEADTSPSFGTMLDLVTISANPGGNAVDVEIFVASA